MEELKHRFIQQYVILMSCIILVEIIVHFLIHNTSLAICLIISQVFFIYTYLLMRRKYDAGKMIHAYMIIAPLYHFYVMLAFWDSTVATFVWLFPLPLAAYVFFSRKEVLAYWLYVILDILAGFLVHKYSGLQFRSYSHDDIIILDTIVFLSNLLIITLLLIYNTKLTKAKFLYEAQGKKLKQDLPKAPKIVISENVEEEKNIDNEIVERLKKSMNDEELFKISNLNTSMMSAHLGISYMHLTRIIRYKGYANFSMYLNTYRVNYVKKLMNENDLQKVTLMYIYTEAGFSNQVTFNRVFKQIEGFTPSEYIAQSNREKE